MRVGWDLTTLCMPATGIGRYTRETLYATARARPDWEFVAVSFAGGEGTARLRASIGELPPNVKHRHIKVPGARFLRRGISSAPFPTLEAITGKVDAFVDSEWFHPRQASGKRISIVYDLGPLLHPEWVDEQTRRFHLRTLNSLKQRADRIVCISEATANDVVRELGVDRERISIVYPGVDEAFFDAKPAPPAILGGAPYVLAVGTLNERKNLGVLIDAFAVVAKRNSEVQLVIVGSPDRDAERIRRRIREQGIEARTTLLGFVSDVELPGIVAGASALVFPSLFEGYGMPVTEAMAAGTPVLVSADASLDEAAGPAVGRFSPLDPDGLARAIAAILKRGRDGASHLVRDHPTLRPWSRSGEDFADVLALTTRR
ncbi:MAG: glycosyltransferase family 1 protein [Actinobacteria bacterium]|nr:glycosyltransferase family 1 protein [Actinomycetota bacterium]